jgi:hypothetical protein
VDFRRKFVALPTTQAGKVVCVCQEKSVTLSIKIIFLMAYNTFKKLEQLQTAFGIDNFLQNWLPTSFPTFDTTLRLLEDLQEASQESLSNEKAKSEYIVVPVLKELRRHNLHTVSVYSGFEFNVDKAKKLTGFCDFILSAETKKMD